MSSKLWEKTNYYSPIEFLIDMPIHEYDITKANISILRDMNVLTEEQYQYYLTAPRMERQIAIGKMLGRKGISDILAQGVSNAKRIFMERNNIQDNEIIAIRNDAIMVISDRHMILDVSDRVKFRLSAIYRSFYKLFRSYYFYYNFDLVTKTEVLDIKGLDDVAIELHRHYMLEFLNELFYTAQIEGVESAIKLLSVVYNDYINMKLDVNYYRELNSASRFRLKPEFSMCKAVYMDFATEWDKRYIDIQFNEKLLRELNRMLASIYFRSPRRK